MKNIYIFRKPICLFLFAFFVMNVGWGQYYWDGSSTSVTSGAITNMTSSTFGSTQGSNNGTTSLISTGSASTGYSTSCNGSKNSSGTSNFGAACKTGTLSTSSSTYFTITLTPNSNFKVSLTSMCFGSRSTSTGPQTITIYSSIDNYSTPIGSASVLNNGTWAESMITFSGSNLVGTTSTAVTLRIYGSGGTGSPGLHTANWRIDDVSIIASCVALSPTLTAVTLGSSLSNTYGTASSGVSFTASGTNLSGNITATAQSGYEVSDGSGYASSVSVTSGSTVFVRHAATKVVSTDNSSTAVVLSSSGASDVNVTTSANGNAVSKANLTVTAGNQSVCYGTSTATVTGNGSSVITGYVNSENSSVITGAVSSYTTSYTNTTAAGTSSITITPDVSGLSASNYSFSTANGTITINALPSISITSSPSSAIVCTGSSVSLTATAGLSSYAWSSGSSTTNTATFSPTTTTTYTVTGTDANGCSATESRTVNYYPASSNVVLASSSVSGAVEQCTESDGYTYYADPASPGQYLFGIYKNGNSFTATVDITVDNVNKYKKNSSSNGTNQEHASYIMSRYWNVNATGTVGAGVKVRFFVDPQDITDLQNARDNDYNTLKNTTNPSTLAVISGTENFKTIGTTYNPTNWTGNKYNGTITKLTQDAVSTLNGQTYVELSGITSFSGGSIGAAFGPSSNGLFNSGGTVGLPVTWKDVKATVKEEGNLIQWTTSSEKNTSHFEVEYSYDAKNFFKASNDIKAAVNSTTDKSYDFMHLEEYGELVYYRIKQVDLDGKVDYSKAVVAKRTSKLPEFHVSMYPVPLNVQDLTVRIQTVQKTDITITINDLLGRGVYTQRVSPQGYTNDHKLSLGHLQNGTYHVTIDNGLHKSVQVLVVGK